MSKYDIQTLQSKSKKLKKKKFNDYNILEFKDITINSLDEIKDAKEFKFLTIEERLKSLNRYLDKINISEKDKNSLINMVRKNSLKNKTDIKFNKFNKEILNITILEFKEQDQLYTFKNLDNNKHITSKKLINNLLIS